MNPLAETASRISAGAFVVVTLREPREKFWGILDAVESAGVYLRCLDLNAYEDALRAAQAGEPVFGTGDLFFPLWRVERVARDTRSGTIPSLAEQFAARTGKPPHLIFDSDAEYNLPPSVADAGDTVS